MKTPKTITVLILLYVLGIVVRVTTPSGFPFRSASILVFSTAVLYWALSIKARITHCRQRCLLIGIATMILLLHVLQLLRYYFAPDASAASRYLWYLYYVPMIIAPVLIPMRRLRSVKFTGQDHSNVAAFKKKGE